MQIRLCCIQCIHMTIYGRMGGGEGGKGKSILQVPDTGTRVLDNTRPFLHSSIVSF